MSVNNQRTRVFVYGNMLRGERCHHLLVGARYLGEDCTRRGYDLVGMGDFPALVPGSHCVFGEVYSVDRALLDQLDEIEEHPAYFRRSRVELIDGTQAETYILPAERAAGCPRIESGDWRRYRAEQVA